MNETRTVGAKGIEEKLVIAEGEWQQLVSRWLPLLPILTRHLQEASGQVEQAVNQICGHFESIAVRTQACVGAATRRVPSTFESETHADAPLDRDIAQLVMALQFQDAVSQRLAEVSGALGELESVLAVWREVPPGRRRGKEGAGYEKWAQRLTRFARPEDAGGMAHGGQATTDTDEQGSPFRTSTITLFD